MRQRRHAWKEGRSAASAGMSAWRAPLPRRGVYGYDDGQQRGRAGAVWPPLVLLHPARRDMVSLGGIH